MLVMAFSLYFYPDAELELAEAVGWYEEQRNKLGFNFYEDYIAIRSQLLQNPGAFPIIFGNVRRANFRKFPYSLFLLLNESQL